MYEVKEQKLDIAIERLNKLMIHLLDTYTIKVGNIIEKLEILNPMNALKRGYSVVKKEGKVVNIKNLKAGDMININMQDGIVTSKIEEVKKGA